MIGLNPEFERLRFDFETIRGRFEKAETHQEKVELVTISKKIVRQARKQIVEYRAAFVLQACSLGAVTRRPPRSLKPDA